MTPFALALVLSFFCLPAACQFGNDSADGFHPDPITTGIFVLLCLFALAFGLLIIWTFVALFTSRGHRSPYAFLLPTLIFFSWSNALYMALIVLENIPSLSSFSDGLPVLLIPVLAFLSNMFNNWGVVLLFLAVIAIVWNRERELRTATEGKFGGHHPALISVHAILASLVFIFGTASEAYNLDTNVKYYLTDELRLGSAIHHRIVVYQQLYYTYISFAIFTAIDVVVSSILSWKSWKNAAIPDKITNMILYGVVPLYSLLSLVFMIFTIMFSDDGLPRSAGIAVFEGASLANTLLATSLILSIVVVILTMSIRKSNWTVGGVEPPKQQYYVPQPQYMYASPPQVAQAGYYVAGPQQPVADPQAQESQPGSYNPGSPPMPQPGSYAPGPAPIQHGQYAESRPGSYAPSLPAAMMSAPGSHSPPQSIQGQPIPVHGQPVHTSEKTGLHVA
ncbi:hypothetical protein C8R43DRAFT_955909 [Mycena crocata]|nr:hypothetical protein C8R43DRAFT_955909 [Mycena crocata]